MICYGVVLLPGSSSRSLPNQITSLPPVTVLCCITFVIFVHRFCSTISFFRLYVTAISSLEWFELSNGDLSKLPLLNVPIFFSIVQDGTIRAELAHLKEKSRRLIGLVYPDGTFTTHLCARYDGFLDPTWTINVRRFNECQGLQIFVIVSASSQDMMNMTSYMNQSHQRANNNHVGRLYSTDWWKIYQPLKEMQRLEKRHTAHKPLHLQIDPLEFLS